MYYKIDLSRYLLRPVPKYQEVTYYNDIKWKQIEQLAREFDNFKDSFGEDWNEIDLYKLRDRLQDNWTFYLASDEDIIKGWAFIDWNRKYPYLANRYVVPKYRNQGLGSDLVWLRCNEIAESGYKTAMIKLEDWNTPALSVMKEDIFTKLKDI